MTVYVLMLNDMREPNIENLTAVAASEDRQELVDLHEANRDPWMDGKWGKTFTKDSPLEWYNPGDMNVPFAYWGGIYEAPEGMSVEDAMRLRLSKT